MASMSSLLTSASTVHMMQNQNQLISFINEIKKFKNNSKQLNMLLDETLESYKELQNKAIVSENLIPMSDKEIENVKFLKTKRLTIVICGQNALAKSIIVNELLSRQLLPFQIENLVNEKWRIVKIKHSRTPNYSFQLIDSDFELMSSSDLKQHNPTTLTNGQMFQISIDDLRINEDNNENEIESQAIIEIGIDSKLLEYECDLIVYSNTMQKSVYEKLSQNIIPIYIYSIIDNQLNNQDINELNELKKITDKNSILFVKIPSIENYKLTPASILTPQTPTTNEYNKFMESMQITNKQMNVNLLKYLQQQSLHQTNQLINYNITLFRHLCDLNLLSIRSNNGAPQAVEEVENDFELVFNKIEQKFYENDYCEKWHLFFYYALLHVRRQFRYLCIYATTILYKFHEKCLNCFINFAYDLARDMLVTPRKLEYAREKELVLFDSLNSLASMKQDELKILINNSIELHRESILNAAREYQFTEAEVFEDNNNENSNGSNQTVTVKYAKDFRKCTQQIQELVITRLNNAVSKQITDSVEVLKENYIGTLKRCLKSLEDMNGSSYSDDMVDNSLQNSDDSGGSSNNSKTVSIDTSSASEALKQILHSAYQVEVTLTGSSNIIKALIERMKELLRNMPWSTTPKLDDEWKVAVASNMLDSLSESKLAKLLCIQMKERLKSSHTLFTTSLKVLETKHNGRLEKTEENQAIIRKKLAPKFAKLCLESTSLKDLILYGMPILGKEIGRGQYGVVYHCSKWAKYSNCAIKSVVPPDEKHWNDLALEFHYTKQITDHERIVKLIGSVIDYSYSGGNSAAVLLIMEGMKRDLYTALKTGLDWLVRLQISLDVVEGIRYLHGRGLVHRDIKLKNVLLDNNNRAKITDLGFCKPEAMMSGSVVGTPVHMAPEVFNSKYDNSVDIYAFGILFWYICAGHVRLPHSFEQCQCKDDLWSAVKRGKRPERLNIFDDDCWKLMESCWTHDPKERPHIGEVYTYLNKILLKYKC